LIVGRQLIAKGLMIESDGEIKTHCS